MKNLLIITYYFPPSGGPGVQRVLKHIKYLKEFGWNPIIFTVLNGQYPAIDDSLLTQIPVNTIIYKSKIFEPYNIYRFFTGKKKGVSIDVNTIKKEGQKLSIKENISEFIRSTFFIPDARIGWLFYANKVLNEIMRIHKPLAIYSSSPPYTCSLLARNLKRKYNIPWVAGFRDPWTDFISSPKRWFLPKYIDKSLEYSVFNESDFVECAWEGIIKDAISKYPTLEKRKFVHIPNGFDSNDFPKINQVKNPKFTITYTGSMYGRRNPYSFFQAIELLIKQNKIVPDNLNIRFVGRFGGEVEEMFENASFKNQIEKINYLPHEKSIEFLLLSDILLLIVDESKESQEIVPGKVYEYIGVRKPIIAIAPQDSAISYLIKETQSGRIAHQSEIELTSEIFLYYYNQWLNNSFNYNPNEKLINNYERRESARKLSNILNQLINI